MKRAFQGLVLAASLLLPVVASQPFVASADGGSPQFNPAFSKIATTPIAPLHTFLPSTKAYPISVQCDHSITTFPMGDGMALADAQTCLPQQTLPVSTSDVLKVRFVASPNHCSDIAVDILPRRTGLPSMGATREYTGFLAPGASSPEYDLSFMGPDVTGLTIWATGRPGGCNTGSLNSWSGTLYVTTTGQ
jgi:hypothetical protein